MGEYEGAVVCAVDADVLVLRGLYVVHIGAVEEDIGEVSVGRGCEEASMDHE